MRIIQEKISELEGVFRKFPEVIAVYLFGSKATGLDTPLSDYDFALLLDKTYDFSATLELELEIRYQLALVLETDQIDVVILNKAPLEIKFEAVNQGKLLYSTDESARIDFEVYAHSMYFDFEPFLQEYRREFFKRIKQGRFLDG